jgi:hypothetical protein
MHLAHLAEKFHQYKAGRSVISSARCGMLRSYRRIGRSILFGFINKVASDVAGLARLFRMGRFYLLRSFVFATVSSAVAPALSLRPLIARYGVRFSASSVRWVYVEGYLKRGQPLRYSPFGIERYLHAAGINRAVTFILWLDDVRILD